MKIAALFAFFFVLTGLVMDQTRPLAGMLIVLAGVASAWIFAALYARSRRA
jgi:hypothetical protein